MSKKHTILVVANVYPPVFVGGAEIIAHKQAKALVKAGHRVIVFAGDHYSGYPKYTIYRDSYEGIPVFRIRVPAENYGNDHVNFYNAEVDAAFSVLVEKYQPDVLHAHNMTGLSLGILGIAKQNGMKVVLTLHDHWGFCLNANLFDPHGNLCETYADCAACLDHVTGDDGFPIPVRVRQDYFSVMLEKVDRFISPSQYLADTYMKAGFPKEKISVIWNGIDAESFRDTEASQSDKLRLTFIGHFGKHKGVMTMLEALSRCRHRDKLVVNLVGEGEELENYKQYIKANRLEELVRFWGQVPNDRIREVYRHTDIYFLASICRENQPVTITEAMICGKPVLASRLGGMVELVQDNETGLLFEAGNADDLARKIDYLADHPEVIKTFGSNGKKRMEGHSFDHQICEILRIYEEEQDNPKQEETGQRTICVAFESGYLLQQAAGRPDDERYCILSWLPDECDVDIAVLKQDTSIPLSKVWKRILSGEILIVPENRDDIVRILRENNCGLYYTKEKTAMDYVNYLLDHPQIYKKMKTQASML